MPRFVRVGLPNHLRAQQIMAGCLSEELQVQPRVLQAPPSRPSRRRPRCPRRAAQTGCAARAGFSSRCSGGFGAWGRRSLDFTCIGQEGHFGPGSVWLSGAEYFVGFSGAPDIAAPARVEFDGEARTLSADQIASSSSSSSSPIHPTGWS